MRIIARKFRTTWSAPNRGDSGVVEFSGGGLCDRSIGGNGVATLLRESEALDGLLTQSRLRVNKDNVLAAKTVKIIPTVFLTRDGRETFTPAQQGLLTNAVDRSLCAGLSERFAVVSPSEPADISVHAAVTHVEPTDPVAVGLSKGAMVVKTVLLPGVPVPVPRIPIGLGSLSLEAEARDQQGSQEAAMIWGRGATALSGGMARASRDGDAYDLAAAFGDDFSKLLVTGETPFGTMPSLPSAEVVRRSLRERA